MKKKLALLILLGMSLFSCSEGEVTTDIDLLSFLEEEQIDYQSESFSLPGDLPLDEDLPSGTGLSYTARSTPITVNLLAGGSDLLDIKSASGVIYQGNYPMNSGCV